LQKNTHKLSHFPRNNNKYNVIIISERDEER